MCSKLTDRKLDLAYGASLLENRKITRNCTTTDPFNGLFSRTTWVSQYHKGKISLDLNEARETTIKNTYAPKNQSMVGKIFLVRRALSRVCKTEGVMGGERWYIDGGSTNRNWYLTFKWLKTAA